MQGDLDLDLQHGTGYHFVGPNTQMNIIRIHVMIKRDVHMYM